MKYFMSIQCLKGWFFKMILSSKDTKRHSWNFDTCITLIYPHSTLDKHRPRGYIGSWINHMFFPMWLRWILTAHTIHWLSACHTCSQVNTESVHLLYLPSVTGAEARTDTYTAKWTIYHNNRALPATDSSQSALSLENKGGILTGR